MRNLVLAIGVLILVVLVLGVSYYAAVQVSVPGPQRATEEKVVSGKEVNYYLSLGDGWRVKSSHVVRNPNWAYAVSKGQVVYEEDVSYLLTRERYP